MRSTSTKSLFRNLVRVAVGIGILAWLFHQMPREELKAVLGESVGRWPWWTAGIGCTFLGLLMGSFRWHYILRAQGFVVPRAEVVRIFFIGVFFNAFLLGACGGDLARAYYVTRGREDRRGAAAMTVIVDRAIGLFTFVLVACAMVLARGARFLTHEKTRVPGILIMTLLVLAVAGAVVLFSRNLFEDWPPFRRLEARTRLGPLLRKAYDALYFYREHPRVTVTACLFSLLNLTFLTLSCAAFGQSVAAGASLADYFTLFPVITVFTAIPITPGALGIREGLFSEMFAAVGVESVRSVPLSLLVYLGGVVWSLFGGVLFLLGSSHADRKLREDIRGLREEKKALREERDPA